MSPEPSAAVCATDCWLSTEQLNNCVMHRRAPALSFYKIFSSLQNQSWNSMFGESLIGELLGSSDKNSCGSVIGIIAGMHESDGGKLGSPPAQLTVTNTQNCQTSFQQWDVIGADHGLVVLSYREPCWVCGCGARARPPMACLASLHCTVWGPPPPLWATTGWLGHLSVKTAHYDKLARIFCALPGPTDLCSDSD